MLPSISSALALSDSKKALHASFYGSIDNNLDGAMPDVQKNKVKNDGFWQGIRSGLEIEVQYNGKALRHHPLLKRRQVMLLN